MRPIHKDVVLYGVVFAALFGVAATIGSWISHGNVGADYMNGLFGVGMGFVVGGIVGGFGSDHELACTNRRCTSDCGTPNASCDDKWSHSAIAGKINDIQTSIASLNGVVAAHGHQIDVLMKQVEKPHDAPPPSFVPTTSDAIEL